MILSETFANIFKNILNRFFYSLSIFQFLLMRAIHFNLKSIFNLKQLLHNKDCLKLAICVIHIWNLFRASYKEDRIKNELNNELLFRSLHFYVPIISTDIQNEWYNFVADNARYSNHKKISYHKDFFIWRCCGSLMHSLVWRIFLLPVDRWKFRTLSATCIATRFIQECLVCIDRLTFVLRWNSRRREEF